MKENISDQLKGVSDAVEDVVSSTENIGSNFKDVAKDVKGFSQEGEKIKSSFDGLDTIKSSTQGVSETMSDAQRSSKELGDGLKSAGEGSKQYGQGVESAGKANQTLAKDSKTANSGLQEQEGLFGRLKGAVKEYGGAIATALGGVAIAGFAKDVVQTGADFQATMSKLSAISGAYEDKSGATMDKLSSKAKELGRTTVFSASEAGDALIELSMAGLSVDEAIATSNDTLLLAQGSGMELADAAGVMTSTMAQFGLKGEKAAKQVSDELLKAATSAKTDVPLLAEGLKYVGASANASNIPLSDTLATLGLLNDAGIEGSSAGTAFNAMLSDLKKEAEGGAIAIGDTAVKIYDSEGAMRGLGDIYADLADATKDMTQEQRDAALMAVFGEQSMRAVNSVLGEGVESFDALAESISNATDEDYGQIMSDEMTDNLLGDIEGLKSAWEGFKISLFETGGIGELLRPIVQLITDIVSGIVEAVESFEGFGDTFDGLFEMINEIAEPLGEAFGEIFESIGEVIENFLESVSEGFELLKPSLETLGEIFGEVWTMIGEVISVAWAIIEPILTFFMEILSIVGQVAMLVFMGIIVPAVQNMWTTIQMAWSVIQPILMLFADLLEVAGEVATWLLNVAIIPLATFIAGTFKAAMDLGAEVIDKIRGAFEKLGEWVGKVKDLFGQFVSAVKSFKPPEWMGKVGGAIAGGIGKVASFVAGSHATGAYNIPYDGYIAELHAGESVLTAGQSQMLRNLGVLQQTSGNRPEVRPEAMVQSISPTTNNTTTTSQSVSFGNINVNVSGSNADPQEIGQAVKRALNREVNKAAAVLGF